MTSTACRTCGQPITRTWAPTDLSLREYHAGCRPGAGRIPYPAHVPSARQAPAGGRTFEAHCSCGWAQPGFTFYFEARNTARLHANDMQAAHDSGQHADGLPRGICAACDFGDAG